VLALFALRLGVEGPIPGKLSYAILQGAQNWMGIVTAAPAIMRSLRMMMCMLGLVSLVQEGDPYRIPLSPAASFVMLLGQVFTVIFISCKMSLD
jgi:ribose/xylose/arabinose/galactoside ABC-type transport system permease subunit